MIQQSGRFEYDENLDAFYDYEKYGTERMNAEDGMFTDRGYIAYKGYYQHGGSDERWSKQPHGDGRAFTMIIRAELKCKQAGCEADPCAVDKVIELPSPRFKQFSRALLADYDFIAENKNAVRHDDDARHCLLVLPADEEYLNAVKAYLDIDAFADAMLCDIRFKVPYIGELIRDTDCPAVEDYNDFAEALEDIWQKDGMLLTYAAVLEAEKPETLHRACDLLQDLDNYQRITEGAYGYGQQRLQETLGLDDEAIYELDGYMDFEKYGQDCMENDCVTKTEFGLLRRLDPSFPEQRQGQRMM